MSNDQSEGRPPQFIGMPPAADDVVAKYAAGVAERREARQAASREGRPKLPNLLQADKQYKPSKDRPMTLDQMAQAQETMDRVAKGEEKAPVRPETLRGLREIKAHSDKEHARMDAEAKPEDKPEEGKAEAKKTEDKVEAKPKKKMSEEEVNERLDSMDDMDLELLMERVRSDIINNEVERKAIDKKVKEIDLAAGLATGEFTQVVPIKKGITVTYRTVSQMENDEMRRILFNWNAEDARVASLAAERYGLMQTVCAMIQLNGEKMPKHLKDDGNGAYEFLEDVFLSKYKLISSYPAPLIHMLGTHAFWFDQRVRKLFTVETVKNG